MAYPIQTLPDYTTQDAASYKAAIDSMAANYARGAGGLSVEAQATPNMTVRVVAGSYFDNSSNTLTEVVAQNATITAAPSAPNNRIDRVVYNTSSLAVQVIVGTPAATPTAPAIPSDTIPLARVTINNGTTAITNSIITDERPAFWQGGGSGIILVRNVYTSGATWTKDTNLLYAEIELVGGGGGGGNTTTSGRCGGGGGAGGYARKVIAAATLGATETVTVGSGGGSAAAGGSTSFGSHLSATGGSAGQVNTATLATGGSGGVGSSGDINLAGQDGHNGINSSGIAWGGRGGSSLLGAGAVEKTTDAAGNSAANGYGAGGSGTFTNTGNSNAGGSGTAGVVIVTEYRRG